MSADSKTETTENVMADDTAVGPINALSDNDLTKEWHKWNDAICGAQKWDSAVAAAQVFRASCEVELHRRGFRRSWKVGTDAWILRKEKRKTETTDERIPLYATQWTVGLYRDNTAGGHDGVVISRLSSKDRCEVMWPREATGQAIAHQLRRLADSLEEADDV